MSQLDLKIGPKIKAFRRQLGLQANKLAEELNFSLGLTTKVGITRDEDLKNKFEIPRLDTNDFPQ